MTKIIIVDDNEDLLEMMCYRLRLLGFSVTCLQETMKLDDEIEKFRPDLLLLDVYLPQKVGIDISRDLKNSQFNKLPILIYSARDILPEDMQQSRADGFIAKPFDFSKFVNLIKTLARRS